ncbi:MAG: hypothetical protein K1000chlam1_01039, partial [Candidatus Anoxychlamydiales bacterium]|nr:hypothetical protein [Candidatus Anoxychlamydiales bacterium]
IALIFVWKYIKKYTPKLSYVRILDFMAVPTVLAGFFIRLGNFFNQEIVGTQTSVFWAVIFVNPMDNIAIVPRHPVQFYEGLCYLFIFLLLYYLTYKKFILKKEGVLVGLFFILVFSSRFFLEFLKVKQSDILDADAFILMGQYLSIPFILIGIFFLFFTKIKSFFLKNNEIIE